ncbi:conserved hypothetical protein [Methanothermus fervidus DSM 2088]|uniref:DUF2073 domain-containing protein n=1 Tax=Methanothermus fervidus (strain ATCC 43054 / DSM 2088 / JCM 10308 / V24 S) TaxID=523846 RepID=E3GYX9_METFV|nr:DUF2073 domain-containing protein [Methanothermus fervidus]ADP77511.1 conserved hypothetical protein [Methanothermus fervidus DSM 2088]
MEKEKLKMDFLSRELLNKKTSMEKISMILEKVKNGNILVIEGGLSPTEEAELIETTMREIDTENFIGIDIQKFEKNKKSFLGFSSKKDVKFTIIGPANIMKTVKRKPNFLSIVAKLGDSCASMHQM